MDKPSIWIRVSSSKLNNIAKIKPQYIIALICLFVFNKLIISLNFEKHGFVLIPDFGSKFTYSL